MRLSHGAVHQPCHPEDSAFTLWLGAKPAALGYEVWADVLRLRGGHDWQRLLEQAIRHDRWSLGSSQRLFTQEIG